MSSQVNFIMSLILANLTFCFLKSARLAKKILTTDELHLSAQLLYLFWLLECDFI